MFTRRISTAGLALTMFAAMTFAQGPRPMGGPGGGEHRLEFLVGYLSLTDAQKTQAKAIFDAAAAAGQTLHGQERSAREALRNAVKAGGADSQFDQLGAAVGTVAGQMAALQAKTEAKFYALLTTDQKTKYDSMHHGPGGPGGTGR